MTNCNTTHIYKIAGTIKEKVATYYLPPKQALQRHMRFQQHQGIIIHVGESVYMYVSPDGWVCTRGA